MIKRINKGLVNDRMYAAIKDDKENGHHFFSEEIMDFWNSTVEAGMYDNDTFITSEDNFDSSKILYTVRKYNWNTHEVETVGMFQAYDNLGDAVEFAIEHGGEF